ncbi:polyprenol monophosphomannose synthase [Thermodesulfobacteriota bacterium]
MISIILPTYNEVDNVKVIIPLLNKLFVEQAIQGEIIIVDDNSPDGTAVEAEKFAKEYPVVVCVRKSEKGLSKSVIKGFELARCDICVVMDSDLSHPVEKIPAMIKPIIEDKFDAVIGSRYLEGGGWERFSLLREIVSRAAGFLAKGITTLSDPTSGFMAIRKSIINGVKLDPLGWKIVLEVAVKANPRIHEIPIMFGERSEGESKLDLRAQCDYLRHLFRLYCYKYLRFIP